MAISGTFAQIKITAASGTTQAAGAMQIVATTAVGSSNKTYEVTTAAHRHWDRSVVPTVYTAGTTAGTPTINSYDYVRGRVTFATTTASAVTADYTYLTASAFANANNWTLNIDAGLLDVNVFGSTWRKVIPGLRSATATVAGFHNLISTNSTDPLGFDYINADTDFVVELHPQSSLDNRYEAYAYLTGNQVGAQVDSVISDSLDFGIDGAMYYTTST